MTGLEVEPSACTWCGIAQRGHGRQYADAVGWHEWAAPSDEQVLARLQARRLARGVAQQGALPMPAGSEPRAELERLEARIAELKEELAALEAQGQMLRQPKSPKPWVSREAQDVSPLHRDYRVGHDLDLPGLGGAG